MIKHKITCGWKSNTWNHSMSWRNMFLYLYVCIYLCNVLYVYVCVCVCVNVWVCVSNWFSIYGQFCGRWNREKKTITITCLQQLTVKLLRRILMHNGMITSYSCKLTTCTQRFVFFHVLVYHILKFFAKFIH